MSESSTYQILAIGLTKRVEEFIEACFTVGGNLTKISSADEFFAQFENWKDGDFAGIFCSSDIPELSGSELGQGLLNQCPTTHKFYITYDLTDYQPSVLSKNGFTHVFCLPQDKELLLRTIKEEILTNVAGKQALRPIKIMDVGADEKLDFGTFVFLPLNNRYIPFSKSNEQIENGRLEKLNKHKVGSLFVDKKDIDKFYSYSAKRPGDAKKTGMGETERNAKLETHVRGIFNTIFDQSIKTDFAAGKEMLDHCQNVIANFITKGISNDLHTKMLSSVGQLLDPYNHASRVSTLAALFAIGLDHPRPEDLALAGMFHDLGMIDIPDTITNKPQEEWTPEELAIYHGHPERTIFYLKQKKLSLTPEIEKAILQHHEKISGQGFPRGISDRISLEAQILSYADQFEYLTRFEPGKKNLSPIEAHIYIERTRSIGTALLEKIGSLIHPQVEE